MMNASCALQHLCDSHGPQILLCTEARTFIHNLNDSDDKRSKPFYSQYIKSENQQGNIECKSCTLSSDGILVTTTDLQNHMLYISSASTPNKELLENTRNACVRSLNVEKSAENNHPILFGDDENGYCLSLTFSCKDFQAHTSQRLYSLCYLCSDKCHLLSLMTLISESMRQVVYWLQSDANETYEQEGRIEINTDGTADTYVTRPLPLESSQRMLSDIVHDSNLIFRIHALFVWLLRTSNSAMNELLFDALPTEEQTTKQERKDIFQYENTNNTHHNSSDLTPTLYSAIDNSNDNQNGFNGDEDYDSLQYQFSSYGYEGLKLFKQFINKLNNIKYLQYIFYNWVIGNQLIIKYTNRTHNKDLIRAFASVFRLFLPYGCCHLIEATSQIVSSTANLILFDTDLITTNGINDNNSIIIKIVLDDNIQLAKLETLPLSRSEIIVPTYVKTIIEVLADNSVDGEAFEAMITQHKIKYLNKAKLYFQLGRCQIASTLSLSERQQMDVLKVKNVNDLSLIRFWQKGLSQSYKIRIRMLKQNDNQEKQNTKKG